MGAKLSDIIVQYYIECPYCKKDGIVEYNEIVDLNVSCSFCMADFQLEKDCKFEVLKRIKK